ncbi:Phosphoenolpyruvate synthase [Planctomycetes bacterium Poly30]|uniref:Phosphoenolpyruvate synthase n=1 Tax=Saltatorellus ferox TaxID=2528018 RepID=A0A518EQI2_9BACT|nr:Phosphoenolpyruvate synthase [Planctomycetes bacterium Poly30]
MTSPTLLPREDALLLWFNEVGKNDADLVGGKGASLGELYCELVPRGVRVPNGFTSTATAYRRFLDAPTPREAWLDVPDAEGLPMLRRTAVQAGCLSDALTACFQDANPEDHLEMHARTQLARDIVVATPVPAEVESALRGAYAELCTEYGAEVDVAVRSSATVEDSDEASFAGQCESYLNVHGPENVVLMWKHCCASLFTERAVSYQVAKNMDPLDASLAVVVMKMVRSDLATSGVMFTLDPDSGHRGVIHISSSYGLGELVVQGSVSPDHFTVWKEGLKSGYAAIVHRHLGAKDLHMVYAAQGATSTESMDTSSARRRQWSLTREEIGELARMALTIEEHYGQPMDIEWAKDGRSQDLFIVQARPETVHARASVNEIVRYHMPAGLARQLAADGAVIAEGQAVGTRIGSGVVRLYKSYEEVILKKRALRERLAAGERLEDIPPAQHVFDKGDVLVTEMTTPDWEPLMKDASLIVTEKGGRTSHAAIIAREFGIPAIVGCEDATKKLKPMQEVTGSCAEGDIALVFDGIHPFEIERQEIDTSVQLDTKIKLNVGFPAKALEDSQLPVDGVGLARLEFILTSEVGVHPLALLYRQELQDYLERGVMVPELERFREAIEAEGEEELRGLIGAIDRRTGAYADKRQFFVDRVMEGVGLICAAFHPRPVLVRLSDLKSNEYRQLLGGRIFEPVEENPMIAWRGASRYVDPDFLPAFEMECDALRLVKRRLGLDNLELMVPFCRSPEEGAAVQRLLTDRGLGAEAGVKLFLMIELPSNVILADEFIDAMGLAGGSIGSNDLVQTVYAVSRDDLEGYRHPVDARSPAVKIMIESAVKSFRDRGLEIGICGQAPSDHPDEVPPFLVDCGISSISVTPDTAMQVRLAVAEAEAKKRKEGRSAQDLEASELESGGTASPEVA